jgi:hypothetical protein
MEKITSGIEPNTPQIAHSAGSTSRNDGKMRRMITLIAEDTRPAEKVGAVNEGSEEGTAMRSVGDWLRGRARGKEWERREKSARYVRDSRVATIKWGRMERKTKNRERI